MREPYIDFGLFRDVYISPVEYIDKSHGSRFLISVNDERIVEGMQIKFSGFDMDESHMRSGKQEFYVNLRIACKGNEYEVKPGVIVRGENDRESIAALIPCVNRNISILDFDLENRAILLNIEPDTSKPVPPESVFVDISFKRLVWFVWLGTVLIAAGGFFAINNAAKRKA